MKRSRVDQCRRGEEGFTLFLVSALLIVAAMVAATLLQQSNRDEFWNPKTESQRRLEVIIKALEYYQRTNLRLPCVASLTAASVDAGHGEEQDYEECKNGDPPMAGTARVDTGVGYMRIGAVPYRTLQLQEEAAMDSWGDKFLYAVTEDLIDPDDYLDGAGIIRVDDGDGTLTNTAAFVVVSHGPDRKGAYTNRGGALQSACNSAQGQDQENCDDDGVFNQFSLNLVTGVNFFDDQIVWREVDYTAQNSP